MIYIETRINEYDSIEYYLKKLFPDINIFRAKLTKEMVDFGFSADSPYVVGLEMTMDEFNDVLEKLKFIDMDEDIDGLELSPTQAGWLHYELTNGKLFEKASGKE